MSNRQGAQQGSGSGFQRTGGNFVSYLISTEKEVKICDFF